MTRQKAKIPKSIRFKIRTQEIAWEILSRPETIAQFKWSAETVEEIRQTLAMRIRHLTGSVALMESKP